MHTLVTVPAFLEQIRKKILHSVKSSKAKTLLNILERPKKLPFFLRRILSYPIRKRLFPSLDSVITGGSALCLEVEDFWENLGIRVVQGYGLTEASPLVTCNSFHQRVRGSVGTVVPKQAIMIDKNQEILIGGENVSSEYYQAPELNEHYFKDGWYRTGDIGRLDSEGNLYICGRTKEMILHSSGMNIFPSDIEAVIQKKKGIREAAVFEYPEGTSTLFAAILLENDQKPSQWNEKDFLYSCNQKLAQQQKLSRAFLWHKNTFPKTATLKLQRKKLIAEYEKSISIQIDDKEIENNDPLLQILSEYTSPSTEITDEANLIHDLGLDSVSMVDLVLSLEAKYSIELDENRLSAGFSVGDLRKELRSPRTCRKRVMSNFSPWSKQQKFLRSLLQKTVEKMWVKPRFSIQVNQKLLYQDSPCIFIANHSSHLDSVAILSTLPPKYRYELAIAAASDYFFSPEKRIQSKIYQLFLPLFPFYRSESFRDNLRNIGELLDRGQSIVLFPEGTRSRSGIMGKFQKGIGVIAKEMQVPIIPIHLTNTHALWPPQEKKPKRGSVLVNYGEPLRFSSHHEIEEITQILENKVKDLGKI